jgi:flagellar motor switch/type III secretory pathway protein FliN
MNNIDNEYVSEVNKRNSMTREGEGYVTAASLREVETLDFSPSFFSELENKRIQRYKVFVKDVGYSYYTCQFGLCLNLNSDDFIKLQVVDNEGSFHNLFVSLQMIWRVSGYWFTKELINWAAEKDDEIFQIIFHAMSDVCNFFSWTIRSIIPIEPGDLKNGMNSLSLKDKDNNILLVASGGKSLIDSCEYTIRSCSVDYHKACLWLGSRIKLPIKFYLNLSNSIIRKSDYESLSTGDLLSLPQQWVSDQVARLKGTAVCKGLRGNLWIQGVFLRMDEKGAKMEFQADEWDRHDGSFEDADLYTSISENAESKIKIAGDGPDAVHLELVVGSTTVSFNDLCALQEGSLLELSSTLLPMAEIKVAGEVIFEGELVRMGNQIMVQITRKVD